MTQPGPGYYPDPDPGAPSGRLRWWDGASWGERTLAEVPPAAEVALAGPDGSGAGGAPDADTSTGAGAAFDAPRDAGLAGRASEGRRAPDASGGGDARDAHGAGRNGVAVLDHPGARSDDLVVVADHDAAADGASTSGAPGAEDLAVPTGAIPTVPTVASQPLGLKAVEVSAWFGSNHVLDRVSLSMEAGRVTALIGPSGCGKSTFLRILNRMHELIPSASLAGEVLLAGEDIYGPTKRLTLARREIGMVFQKPNPFPAMSIADNVLAGLKLTGTKLSKGEREHLVEESLARAGLWAEVRDRLRQPGGGLSGGQQQRLCIARSLAVRPRVLLMDEPCSALDPTSTRRVEETILAIASEVTVVIVTHNMQQAARVSDHCAFFLAAQNQPGGIVEHGPTVDMFERPQDPRTADYVNGRFG